MKEDIDHRNLLPPFLYPNINGDDQSYRIVETNSKSDFTISPNPAYNKINISGLIRDTNPTSNEIKLKLYIVDELGQYLYNFENTYQSKSLLQKEIDISFLSSGHYYIIGSKDNLEAIFSMPFTKI